MTTTDAAAHSISCRGNAEGAVWEEIALQDLAVTVDAKANTCVIVSWDMTTIQVAASWIVDGTVSCQCD